MPANENVNLLFIHALTENTAMLKIARNAGASVERNGSESDAYLKLPPADLDSRMTEIVEEHFAQTDYRLKVQAKQFWDFLSTVQEVRSGVREGPPQVGHLSDRLFCQGRGLAVRHGNPLSLRFLHYRTHQCQTPTRHAMSASPIRTNAAFCRKWPSFSTPAPTPKTS